MSNHAEPVQVHKAFQRKPWILCLLVCGHQGLSLLFSLNLILWKQAGKVSQGPYLNALWLLLWQPHHKRHTYVLSFRSQTAFPYTLRSETTVRWCNATSVLSDLLPQEFMFEGWHYVSHCRDGISVFFMWWVISWIMEQLFLYDVVAHMVYYNQNIPAS